MGRRSGKGEGREGVGVLGRGRRGGGVNEVGMGVGAGGGVIHTGRDVGER